ncbi:MAG TPA: pyridoxal-phosphate dependent enzyme [Streptosporangiaceae bacterium]
MTASPVPDLADVFAARQRIAPYLPATPLYRYPALDAMTGARLWVKHENHQPVGAFKVRGGVNLISQLGTDERQRGVIAASTGNHGQSVAYAADLFGVRAVICMPEQAVRPSVEVIGVQSEAAPAAYRSWRAGALVEDSTSTFAEGLATRTAFELPQQIMRDLLDDFVLVPDDALKAATRVMIEKTRNLVEPAGAAALAAVLAAPQRFAGRKVAIVCSGGNISPAQLTALWPGGSLAR